MPRKNTTEIADKNLRTRKRNGRFTAECARCGCPAGCACDGDCGCGVVKTPRNETR